MPEFTAGAPEGTTHVTIWDFPPEYRWFDSEEAASAFARRVAGEGGRGVEVREAADAKHSPGCRAWTDAAPGQRGCVCRVSEGVPDDY